MNEHVQTIAIVGYYGYANSGDEAVLHAILTALADEAQRLDVRIRPVVVSGDVGHTTRVHGIEAVGRGDVRAVWSLLRDARVCIFGGGSLLQDVTSMRSMVYYMSMMELAHRAGALVVWYAQGIGPIRRSWLFGRWVRSMAERSLAVFVRDDASHDLLVRFGVDAGHVRVCADPVCGCTAGVGHVFPATLGVAIRAWRADGADVQEIGRTVAQWQRRTGNDVVLLPFHEPEDRHTAHILAHAYGWTVHAPTEHPQHMIDAVAQCTWVLGMRLHALIYAAVGGVPFVAVSYDPKIEQFAARLAVPIACTTEDVSGLLPALSTCTNTPRSAWNAARSTHMDSLRVQARMPAQKVVRALHDDVSVLFGVAVSRKSMTGIARVLFEAIRTKRATHVVTLNPIMLMHGLRDRAYLRMLRQAELVVADGIGVVWAAWWRGQPVRGRVTGYDVVQELLQEAAKHGWRVYMLGASQDVVEEAARRMQQMHRGLCIVGCETGYFEDDEAVLARIAQAQPHILLVGRSLATQDRWIAQHRARLDVPVMIGCGGSFDVMAGRLHRAPQWVQRMHMEWLYRLMQQPRRLGRMMALPRFVVRMLIWGDRVPRQRL
ncbi:MAG: polysaccharide pyruvyl transferase CsaB [Paenibacillaceae bacterium]|nr:polysaccharide pyruvyl transferase CsaB [Paenibacillaceae bacterium]